MSFDPIARINAALAMPKTHAVITRYESGAEYRHECRSIAAAENWAIGERRKIGRELIDRDTGETVTVVAVDIITL